MRLRKFSLDFYRFFFYLVINGLSTTEEPSQTYLVNGFYWMLSVCRSFYSLLYSSYSVHLILMFIPQRFVSRLVEEATNLVSVSYFSDKMEIRVGLNVFFNDSDEMDGADSSCEETTNLFPFAFFNTVKRQS